MREATETSSLGGGSEDPLLGRVVADRYRLESLLGTGAMGCVYRARHLLIDRSVAIKILDPRSLGSSQGRNWFLREARAVNLVNHVNIVEIYDYGETEDGLVYLVMELLSGARLCDRIAAGPRDVAWSLDIVEQIAAALARAHDLGVVHCDLKPEHVFLIERAGRRDFVKLIDFGLARIARERQLAAHGAVFGTPEYLSPEQARGEQPGPQADLYSLGVLLYEMVTGRLPFESDDHATLLACHRAEVPVDPRQLRSDLDSGVASLILGLLEKYLTRRYRDAHQVVDLCKELQNRLEPQTSRPAERLDMPRPPGTVASTEGVSIWALRAATFGQVCAAVYPEGGEPPEVLVAVNGIWRTVAALARLEGEMHVLEAWHENLRARSREHLGHLGRRIEELSRTRSRLLRQIAASDEELESLRATAAEAERSLLVERFRADASERADDGEELKVSLQLAGAAAASLQHAQQSAAKLEAKIGKWRRACQEQETRAGKLRVQLAQVAEQAQAALRSERPRFSALARDHEVARLRLRELDLTLTTHFSRRPECRRLLEELDRAPARSTAESGA